MGTLKNAAGLYIGYKKYKQMNRMEDLSRQTALSSQSTASQVASTNKKLDELANRYDSATAREESEYIASVMESQTASVDDLKDALEHAKDLAMYGNTRFVKDTASEWVVELNDAICVKENGMTLAQMKEQSFACLNFHAMWHNQPSIVKMFKVESEPCPVCGRKSS